MGYPLPGKSGSFAGLCSFNCNHAYCPDSVCGTTPSNGVVLGYSPFLPPACTGGTGEGAFQGLCSFGCNFGFCPMHACTCTSRGILIQQPPKTDVTGYFLDSSTNDHGLCKFACEHGYCPDICGSRSIDPSGNDSGYPTITLDPVVWHSRTAQCVPPCVLVIPPSTLGSTITLSFEDLHTQLEVGWTATDTTSGSVISHYTATTVSVVVPIPPMTVDVISFSEELIRASAGGMIPAVITPRPSIKPPPLRITPSVTGLPVSPIGRMIFPPPWPGTGSAPLPGPSGTPPANRTTSPIAAVPTADGSSPTTVFPTQTVSWVQQWVPEPTVTQVGGGPPVPVIPCWVWFIWSCPPNVGGIVLSGFEKPGVYPM